MTLPRGAGNLRRRITLQANSGEVPDPDTGILGSGWVDVAADIPASIEPVSAREFIASAATQVRVTTRITVRYREDVTAKMRCVDDRGHIYGIEQVLPDKNSGLEYLTLVCAEGEDAT